MNNFHGGPGGPFPGPGFGPGFGPAPGPGFGPAPGGVPLEVESQFMYGGVGGGSSNEHRIPLDILSAKKLPSSRFFSRLKVRLKRANLRSNIRSVNKYLRRAQIQQMILENMGSLSHSYGDNARVFADITTDEIIDTLDQNNKKIKLKEKFLFNNLRNKIERKKERFYVGYYKFKSYIKYGKSEKKRSYQLRKANQDVDYRKDKLLDGWLLHNYNIYSILLGDISKKNGFKGLLPDSADLETVKNANKQKTVPQNIQQSNTQNKTVSQNNTNTQTNTKTQSNVNTQNNAKTQVNATPQPVKIQSQPSPVKISDINDYPPVYVDPWIEGMFSNDWEKADESVSMDVEILDDKTHHHK